MEGNRTRARRPRRAGDPRPAGWAATYDLRFLHLSRRGIASSPTTIATITAPDTLAATGASSVPWTGVTTRPANLAALAGSEAIQNALVPLNGNAVVNSEFALGVLGWALNTSNTTGLTASRALNQAGFSGNRNAVYAAGAGTSAGGGTLGIYQSVPSVSLANLKLYALPVLPGDRILVSARVACNAACTGVQVMAAFYTDAATPAFVALTAGAFDGARLFRRRWRPETTSSRAQGYVTVPATAKFAYLLCRATVSAGGVNPYAVLMEPMIARVPATQTATPVPYQPGRDNPLGDQTAVNVAPSIVGQGLGRDGLAGCGGQQLCPAHTPTASSIRNSRSARSAGHLTLPTRRASRPRGR